MENNFYKDLLDNLYDGVYFVDNKRMITYWNNAAERITGFSKEQVVGSYCADNLLNHVNDAGLCLCEGECPLKKTIEDGSVQQNEVFLHHKNGHLVPVLIRTSPIRSAEGSIIGAVEVFADNSNMVNVRSKVDELENTKYRDTLTDLSNRLHIEMKLSTSINEFNAGSPSFGILFIDIDNFKTVNDNYGHLTGDQVLKVVSTTLRRNIRTTDLVGRWGGEEFLVIVYGLNDKDLWLVAEKLRNLVDQSRCYVDGRKIGVTISMGVTRVREGDTANVLIQRVDQLLYKSKIDGRNRVTIDMNNGMG